MRAIALVLLSIVSACTSETDARPLRIGLNPWPGYLDLSLAAQQGFFADEGLKVQIVEFSSLYDLVRAFQLGQIDLIPCTLVEIREVNRNRRKAEIVRVLDSSEGPDVVLAHMDGDEFDPRGQKIAYEPASLGAYLLQRFLDERGLTLADVDPVPMDQLQIVRAMAEKRVAAAVTYPPNSIEITKIPQVRSVYSSAEIPGEIVDVLAVDPDLLDRDASFLSRISAALLATERFADEHPLEAIRHKAAVLGIPPEEWHAATAGIHIYRTADQAEWIWHSDRLDQLMRGIDDVLASAPGERPCMPERFRCNSRPMPDVFRAVEDPGSRQQR